MIASVLFAVSGVLQIAKMIGFYVLVFCVVWGLIIEVRKFYLDK